MGTGSVPRVKSGRGVTLTPHPLLVPWSWNCRAIPLLPLWAVRPVQSLNACTRVTFTFLFFLLYTWFDEPHPSPERSYPTRLITSVHASYKRVIAFHNFHVFRTARTVAFTVSTNKYTEYNRMQIIKYNLYFFTVHVNDIHI